MIRPQSESINPNLLREQPLGEEPRAAAQDKPDTRAQAEAGARSRGYAQAYPVLEAGALGGAVRAANRGGGDGGEGGSRKVVVRRHVQEGVNFPAVPSWHKSRVYLTGAHLIQASQGPNWLRLLKCFGSVV